jgi:hypothetical protein
MPKGKHAEYERIHIDDQLYLLKYADGRIKVCLKEGTLVVTEVMTRNGNSTPGSHVFMSTRRNTHPKPVRTQQETIIPFVSDGEHGTRFPDAQ